MNYTARNVLGVIGLFVSISAIAVLLVALNTNGDLRSRASLLLTKAPTYIRIPATQVDSFKKGQWRLVVSATNTNPSDWSLPNRRAPSGEDLVFWRQLNHIQEGKNWTIKVGKGGQLYSLKMPETGELIARQRTDSGEWVDEVFQHVIPSVLQKQKSRMSEIVDGDIHQAGYYTQSDYDNAIQVIPRSVYSPTFAKILSELNTDRDTSFSFITWPQHAHLPRKYTDNGMLMHQSIRDVGDGVVEITLVIDKWSGAETTSISVPWSGLRTEVVPTHIMSSTDGSYNVVTQPFASGDIARLHSNTTGGWMAFVQRDHPDAYGLGIVFGKHQSNVEGVTSYARWGNYTTGTVATVKRDIKLLPGDSVFFRYYLVFGRLRDIQSYGNLLVDKVQIGKLNTRDIAPGAVRICRAAGQDSLQRGCPKVEQLLFFTNRYHTSTSLPLFLLKNTRNGQVVLATDPYAVSNNPTDGSTEYSDFLGWVYSPQESPSCAVLLSSVLGSKDIRIHESARGVFVRTDAGCR